MRNKNQPLLLVILDGFGFSTRTEYNAVHQAYKPNFNDWLTHYPNTLLKTSGQAVGLPPGYPGNSEVGHITIGAGRIVKQDITRINDAIENESFFTNSNLIKAFHSVASHGSTLHLVGLMSDGGIHSLEQHVYALIQAASINKVKRVLIHAILDGRDVPPVSAHHYLRACDDMCKRYGLGNIATIHGRFYAMDRDNNWERTQLSYDVMTEPRSILYNNWQSALANYYQLNLTDEFIPPTAVLEHSAIHERDAIIFFNFRADRMRQLVSLFLQGGELSTVSVVTMTEYNATFEVPVLFKPLIINTTLKQVLDNHGVTIFTIAETEKYAHVTYFFDGGREETFKHETRVMIPSIVRKNYVHVPCMSASGITDAVIHSLRTDQKKFYLINYANPDMVGHSGDFNATVRAIECIDHELGRLYQAIKLYDGVMLITGDHGKAEEMFDIAHNQVKTAHSKNDVYFIAINMQDYERVESMSTLADISPYILECMGIAIPDIMKK